MLPHTLEYLAIARKTSKHLEVATVQPPTAERALGNEKGGGGGSQRQCTAVTFTSNVILFVILIMTL